VKSHPDQNSSGAQEILNLEVHRKEIFSDICKVESCSHKTKTGELPPKAKNSFSRHNRAQLVDPIVVVGMQQVDRVENTNKELSDKCLDETQGDDTITPRCSTRAIIDLEEDLEEMAWTKVENRKRIKRKVINDRFVLEY
jgi:hypothetical protein